MSVPANPAVFLSYASQDAEAVRRIAEALRAAGVEVWFDQNELVGGDAWDQKIRGQIASCALFVPVISAATQARREGYFRLEWKLAAQRTHMISERQAFLLPVVIDGTSDAAADVPVEFRAVQWTRLPGGETPEKFCARVKALLAGEAAAASSEVGARLVRAHPDGRGRATPLHKPRRRWLVTAIISVAVVAALVIWQPWRVKEKPATPASPAAAIAPTAPLTEAQQLVAKARKVWEEGDEINLETYALVEELLVRAEERDPAEASAWAFHAWVSAFSYGFALGPQSKRLEAFRTQAERASKLAPGTKEAELAAGALRFGMAVRQRQDLAEPGRQLRELAAKYPDDPLVAELLGRSLSLVKNLDEAITVLNQALARQPDNPRLKASLINAYYQNGRISEAEACVQRWMGGPPVGRIVTFDVHFKCWWRGDLKGAAEAIEKWPQWLLLEDRGIQRASLVYFWKRDATKLRQLMERFPRDYVRDTLFTGPRSVFIAWAHELAGRDQEAKAEWRTTLQIAERELAAEPGSLPARYWKTWAQARLGDSIAAETGLKLLEEDQAGLNSFMLVTGGVAGLQITLGHLDRALASLQAQDAKVGGGSRVITKAQLTLSPVFDPLRSDPRFQALIEAAPGPQEKKENASTGAAALDPKSIAVLAFANMSADKDNEYFSDGLSEEILDKLARNPALRVMARTSSFSYKGKNVPIPQIGRELNVGTIIDGSVRRAGNQLRITAQLINAADGTHIWSETYNKELTTADIFAIQEEIAQKIAARLAPNSAPAKSMVAAVPTKNLEAYEAYLRGRQSLLSDGRTKTVGFFAQATELDPGFALAWVQLARAHAWLYFTGGEVDEERERALARAAIDQAQRLQPDLPDIHLALAAFRAFVESDYPSASRELDLLARSRPEDSDTFALRGGIELRVGRFAGAITALQRAVDLDPKNAAALNSLGLSLDFAGRYVEAISVFERAAQTEGSGAPLLNRARTLLKWKGDPKGVVADLQSIADERLLVARSTSSAITFYWTAGDHIRALELAERSGWSGTFGQWEYLFGDLLKARIREAMGEIEQARREYLAVLPQIERTRDAHPRVLSSLPAAGPSLCRFGP